MLKVRDLSGESASFVYGALADCSRDGFWFFFNRQYQPPALDELPDFIA
ncbi:hypothetical protein [Pseudomonas sp. NGC7]